jgi:hypothetical protein
MISTETRSQRGGWLPYSLTGLALAVAVSGVVFDMKVHIYGLNGIISLLSLAGGTFAVLSMAARVHGHRGRALVHGVVAGLFLALPAFALGVLISMYLGIGPRIYLP